MRVNKIYDIDKKTYLFRMQRTEEKAVIMLESGSRIHTTNSVWPKSDAPSGFTMKLRKHLRNKRLEDIYQFKTDRIAVLQFGINEVANYVIVELYDRGKSKIYYIISNYLSNCDCLISFFTFRKYYPY